MLISLVSAKGSPGVTTAALAIGACWPRTAIVADLDPQGGDMLAGLTGGLQQSGRGIVDVLVDSRHGDLVPALRRHVIRPAPHSPLVLGGFGAPGQAAAVSWAPVAAVLTNLPGADVVADCGRVVPGHPIGEVLRRSVLTVLVTASSLRAVRAAARVVPQLRGDLGLAADDEAFGLLVTGPDTPYSVEEIEQACEAEVVGTLPDDPRSARAWTDAVGPSRRFARSALQRAAEDVAAELAERVDDIVQRSPTDGVRR